MIRIAAVGDVHFGIDSAGLMRPHVERLHERADVLLLAGDLTWSGQLEEAKVLAEELRDLQIPRLAVLGNHDHHCDQEAAIADELQEAGVRVLEGDSEVVRAGDATLGIAGVKGFGGGFAGASGSDFGEREMKAFMRHTKDVAAKLEEALHALQTDVKVALMHYSPIKGTLLGERLEIYPFLGSYFLGEAVDRAGCDLAIHGHAHGGTEKGVTPGGIHVRNVAQPVIQHAFNLYCIGSGDDVECEVPPVGRRADNA